MDGLIGVISSIIEFVVEIEVISVSSTKIE